MSAPPADIDALFRLPLGEFTTARNALVAHLKKAGKHAEAEATKALAKPSAAAWAVNQLYWRHREAFDRLLETGERLRGAHAAQLTAEAARDRAAARRGLLTELGGIAAGILRAGGQNPTRELMRRVTGTLEAFSSYGSQPGAPAAGRLTEALEPPGFEVVAGLLPAGAARGAIRAQRPVRSPDVEREAKPAGSSNGAVRERRERDDRRRLLSAAKAAVREAEGRLSAARKRTERAAAQADAATRRVNELDKRRARAEKQLARASQDASAARARANDATASLGAAAQAAEDVERALESARGRLRQLAEGNG